MFLAGGLCDCADAFRHDRRTKSDELFPRQNLWTNKGADAWAEQFHMLFYVLHMTPEQIAQIDFGVDPEHPAARLVVLSWAHDIKRDFPRVEAHPWTGNFFR